eukprot:RCo039488
MIQLPDCARADVRPGFRETLQQLLAGIPIWLSYVGNQKFRFDVDTALLWADPPLSVMDVSATVAGPHRLKRAGDLGVKFTRPYLLSHWGARQAEQLEGIKAAILEAVEDGVVPCPEPYRAYCRTVAQEGPRQRLSPAAKEFLRGSPRLCEGVAKIWNDLLRLQTELEAELQPQAERDDDSTLALPLLREATGVWVVAQTYFHWFPNCRSVPPENLTQCAKEEWMAQLQCCQSSGCGGEGAGLSETTFSENLWNVVDAIRDTSTEDESAMLLNLFHALLFTPSNVEALRGVTASRGSPRAPTPATQPLPEHPLNEDEHLLDEAVAGLRDANPFLAKNLVDPGALSSVRAADAGRGGLETDATALLRIARQVPPLLPRAEALLQRTRRPSASRSAPLRRPQTSSSATTTATTNTTTTSYGTPTTLPAGKGFGVGSRVSSAKPGGGRPPLVGRPGVHTRWSPEDSPPQAMGSASSLLSCSPKALPGVNPIRPKTAASPPVRTSSTRSRPSTASVFFIDPYDPPSPSYTTLLPPGPGSGFTHTSTLPSTLRYALGGEVAPPGSPAVTPLEPTPWETLQLLSTAPCDRAEALQERGSARAVVRRADLRGKGFGLEVEEDPEDAPLLVSAAQAVLMQKHPYRAPRPQSGLGSPLPYFGVGAPSILLGGQGVSPRTAARALFPGDGSRRLLAAKLSAAEQDGSREKRRPGTAPNGSKPFSMALVQTATTYDLASPAVDSAPVEVCRHAFPVRAMAPLLRSSPCAASSAVQKPGRS